MESVSSAPCCRYLTLKFEIQFGLFSQAGPLVPFGMMGMVSIIIVTTLNNIAVKENLFEKRLKWEDF